MPTIYRIKGKLSTKEGKAWEKWMAGVDSIHRRYAKAHDGDDNPFAYNEAASVSILTAGAAMAGFVALADYCVGKKSSDTGKDKNGRCDLYLMANEHTWSFEFKQLSPYSAPTKKGRLESSLKSALKDVGELTGEDHECAFAGLIIPLGKLEDSAALARARENIVNFCNEDNRIRFAYQFSKRKKDLETFILFAQSGLS